MRGIQFVTNDQGKKTAVLIDLEEWGNIWEDIYDVMISKSRLSEPTISWDQLKAEMDQEGRPSGKVSR